jgi:AcrR family transcriptional regulator
LSWRPVAAALGVSPTTLVHHFGTKEQMLEAILGRLRERIFVATRDPAGEQPDLATEAGRPGPGPPTRNTQRSSGCSSRFPDVRCRLRSSSQRSSSTWSPTARRAATGVIATIRGLLLDLLATGDRDRVQDTAERFLASLEHTARPPTPALGTDAQPGPRA